MDNLRLFFAIVFAIILILLLMVFLIFKIAKFAEKFRVDKLVEAYKEYENLPKEPKTLSGMDKIYAPLIKRDFPEINIEELKVTAKSTLTDIFMAIENKDMKIIGKCSTLVKNKVNNIIENQKKLNQKEHFNDINFHNVVISKYENKSGYIVIVMQLALEFIHFISQNGDIINGSSENKQQERFEVSFAYIQDIDKIEESDLKAGVYGLNCPNCAAPIKKVGQKICEYCGSSVVYVNSKSWFIIDYLRM